MRKKYIKNNRVNIKWIQRDDNNRNNHLRYYQIKPPRELNLILLDYDIERQLVSSRDQSRFKRGIKRDDATVILYYKRLKDVSERARFVKDGPTLTNFLLNQQTSEMHKAIDPVLRDSKRKHARSFSTHKCEVSGESEVVFAEVIKNLPKTDQDDFITTWKESFYNTLSSHVSHIEDKSNKNNTQINPDDSPDYGIYNLRSPGDILAEKMKINNLNPEQLNKGTGISVATIYRHLEGKIDVSRNHSIKYAQFLGIDPSEILFNELEIPIHGYVNASGRMFEDLNYNTDINSFEYQNLKKPAAQYSFKNKTNIDFVRRYTSCPREIYRPDIKALQISIPESQYHEHIIFYYDTEIASDDIRLVKRNSLGLCVFEGIIKSTQGGYTSKQNFFGIPEVRLDRKIGHNKVRVADNTAELPKDAFEFHKEKNSIPVDILKFEQNHTLFPDATKSFTENLALIGKKEVADSKNFFSGNYACRGFIGKIFLVVAILNPKILNKNLRSKFLRDEEKMSKEYYNRHALQSELDKTKLLALNENKDKMIENYEKIISSLERIDKNNEKIQRTHKEKEVIYDTLVKKLEEKQKALEAMLSAYENKGPR